MTNIYLVNMLSLCQIWNCGRTLLLLTKKSFLYFVKEREIYSLKVVMSKQYSYAAAKQNKLLVPAFWNGCQQVSWNEFKIYMQMKLCVGTVYLTLDKYSWMKCFPYNLDVCVTKKASRRWWDSGVECVCCSNVRWITGVDFFSAQ